MVGRIFQLMVFAVIAMLYIQMGWLAKEAPWWQNLSAVVLLTGLGSWLRR